MKKHIHSVFVLLLTLYAFSASAGSNVMKIHDVIADPGDVITVELEIINDDPFNAFQLDIPLPAGFTYVAGSAQLNPARSNNHLIMSNVLGSGALRLIAFHVSNLNFQGNDGIVATFQLETPGVPGIHALNITNATISGADGNIITGTIPGTVTLEGDIPQATLTMSFNGSGGATVNGTPYTAPVTVDQGTTLTVEALADSGWEFDNWSGALTGDASPTTILMDGDKHVTANFSELEPTQYTLTININGEGEVRVNGTPYTEPMLFNEGATVFLYAVPDAGWQFDNWSGNLTGTHPLTNITMNGDKTVGAHFSISTTPQYTLTMSLEGEGVATVNGIPYTEPMLFNEGVSVELQAIPASGWEFDNWSGDLTGDASPITIVMDDDKEVTANFSEIETVQYTLTININGEGMVEVDGANYVDPLDFDEGTSVMLEAIPLEGWQFENWSGSIAGTLPETSVTLDGDKTVNANFTPIPESDNIMQINDAHGEGGQIIDLELEIINDDEFVGFQTDIYLPAGFSYVEGSASLNPARALDHFLDANIMDDGALRLVSASFINTAYLGNDGPVVFFSLTTPPVAGDYDIELTDPVISDVDGDNILTESFDGTITLTEPVIVTYTINASSGPNGTINPEGEVEVEEGDDQTFVIIPDDNYHISEILVDGAAINLEDDPAWDADAGAYTFTDVQQNHTIHTNFSINTYTILYMAGENGTLDGETEQVVEHGQSGSPVLAIPDEGYEFAGWSDGVTDNPRTDENVTADIEATALFEAIDYELEVDILPEDAGSVALVPEQDHYNFGDEVTLTATAADGFVFQNWRLDGVVIEESASFVFLMPAADVTLVAHFVEEEVPLYDIVLFANPVEGGAVSGGGSFVAGETITVLAEPAEGYRFVGWREGNSFHSRDAEYTFEVTRNRDLFAHFALKRYTITLGSLPEGGVGGAVTGAGTYAHGTEVLVRARANQHYGFDGWTEADELVSTELNYQFTITGDRHLIANFSGNTYTIEVIPHPAEGGSVTGGGEYNEGEAVSVAAIPNDGYFFLRWLDDDGDQVSLQNPYLFTASANRELRAEFFGPFAGQKPNENDNAEVTLYPNPADDKLHIRAKEQINRVEVVDMNGRVAYRGNPLTSKHTLSVSGLLPGTYIIYVYTETGIATEKVRVTR